MLGILKHAYLHTYYMSKLNVYKVKNKCLTLGASTRGHCWTERCDATTLCISSGLCCTSRFRVGFIRCYRSMHSVYGISGRI